MRSRAALRAHALGVATQHQVRVRECAGIELAGAPETGPKAWVEHRVVDVAPIRERVSYLVALHEVGHCVVPGGGGELMGEARAWRWAMAESIVPVDAGLRRLVELAWLTHVRALGGDELGGGCELVSDEDLAEYLQTWMRVAYPGVARGGSVSYAGFAPQSSRTPSRAGLLTAAAPVWP